MNLDLEELLKQKENSKLDFKRQWYWNVDTPSNKMEMFWGECIKDILALTNGNPHNVNETAYLIIGIEDESKNTCQFDLPKDKSEKIFTESKLQQTLLSKLNTYAQPEFTALHVEYKSFQKHKVIVISIPAREKLISLSKDLKHKSGTDKKGTTYYRVGEEIRVVSSDIYEDYSKARQDNFQDISKIIEQLGGSEENFLKKYFGGDYIVALENPQTYTNLKYKLLTVNITLDSVLKEKEDLKVKIKLQEFDDEVKEKVQKAMLELRFNDAIKILDEYLSSITDTKEGIYQAHYMKAIVYMQNLQYLKAKEEIEFIPYVKVNDIRLLNDYAWIYNLVGNYPKSIEIYDFILSEKKKELQTNLYLLTMLYNNVAHISEKIGYMDNVERYYREALIIIKNNGLDKSKEYATILNNLGVFLDSEKYIQDALLIRKELFGDNDIETMQSYNNLALYYVKIARYNDAELLFYDVLKFKLKHYGNFHPEIAEIYNNIAELHKKRGGYDFKEVESLYLESIKIVENFFGENHDLLANKLNNIGELYRENNQSKEALNHYKNALTIYKSSFGREEHATIATVYGNMALSYQELGNTIQSYNYHKKALDIRYKVLKEDDYYIGLSHANLTGFYNLLEKFNDAYFHVCKVVDIWQECLDKNHPDLLKAVETKSMLGKII